MEFMTFEQYIIECDRLMNERVGLDCDDMPDLLSIADYHDHQIAPAKYVEDLIAECGGSGF